MLLPESAYYGGINATANLFCLSSPKKWANTRKTLERVPDEKLSWKPHQKSSTMIALAGHLANIPGWVVETVKKESFDMCPGGKPFEPPPVPKDRKELLQTFDKNVVEARATLASASGADLQKPLVVSQHRNGGLLHAQKRLCAVG